HGPGGARIVALPGAVGVATENAGVGGMVSVNTIVDETLAYLKDSTVRNDSASPAGADNGVTVHAKDDSFVISVGLAVGVAQDVAVGAAGGVNNVGNNVPPFLDTADLGQGSASTALKGGLTVTAENRTQIGSATAAGSGANDVSVAANVSFDLIANTTEASVKNGSNVHTTGAVDLSASDSSQI